MTVRFESVEAARRWLVGYEGSGIAMNALREIVQRERSESAGGRMSDEQVLAAIAAMMVAGRLLVAPQLRPLPPQGLSFERSASAPSQPSVARTRAPSAPPPPAVEDSTLPRDTDAAAMAATLIAAAADGVPFCEICEQRKRAQRQPAGATA